MRVVVAPDSFKGSVAAAGAARALADGWLRARPGDDVATVPLADGGEGTLDALAAGAPARSRRTAWVTGPGSTPVAADWLLLPDGTAVVELAQAAGITLLDPLDPLHATTRGVGELLRLAAADPATTRVVLALGGSATTDGGAGALAALGARLLDAAGAPLPPGGAALARLASVDVSALAPAPPGGVECLADVTAPLVGPHGAAAVFGPQKGASPGDVAVLDAALTRFARVLADALWARAAGGAVDPATPGAGAAGGTAFGVLSVWGGRIVSGARTVADVVGLPALLAEADVVVTGEGSFDAQSLTGKVVGHVLAEAAAAGTRVLLAAGRVDGSALAGTAVARAVSLTDLAGSAPAAMAEPARWLAEAGAALAADA